MIRLNGNWAFGAAFDEHTTESVHSGTRENGTAKFDTKRTEMGELIYTLKYKKDQSALPNIIKLLDQIEFGPKFDFIIPIPPTDRTRIFQPVILIATAFGTRLGTPVLTETLIKLEGGKELKSITEPQEREDALRECLCVNDAPVLHGKSVLLIDDLYRSGATLRVSTDLLMNVAKVRVVYVLTMTKTRVHR
jgi:predicted amidophosphoribosyltransferase